MKTIEEITAEIDINHLIEICEAERDGRLVVLPCKVGDTVYELVKTFVQNKLVWSIDTRIIDELNSNKLNSNTMVSKKPFELHFSPSEIGKSVFLKREEAEKALVERRGEQLKKEIEEIIENLEFLISEDCTDTQFDYVDDIENAIELIKTVKNAEMSNSRLTEICEAEHDGNLIVLPCKVGDKVFITNLLKYGKQYYFKNYYFNFNGEIIMNIYDRFEKENYPIKLNDFGKTVFLTREEAKKALVEMEENNEL